MLLKLAVVILDILIFKHEVHGSQPLQQIMASVEEGVRLAQTYRKRFPLNAEEAQPSHRTSFLVNVLLRLWGWGVLSSPNLQEIALGAVKDGIDHGEVKLMATIGCDGKFPGNMRAEIKTRFFKHIDIPEPEDVLVPVVPHKALVEAPVEWVQHPVLHPRTTFLSLKQNYPQQYSKVVGLVKTTSK